MGFGAGKVGNVALENILTNTSLFEFTFQEYRYELDANTNSFNISYENIEYDFCSVNSVDYSEAFLNSFNINIFFCPSNNNYKIKSNLASPLSYYLNLTVSKCKDKSYWLSDDQINEVLNSLDTQFYFGFQTYYVDSEDFDNPLKPYINDDLIWSLAPGLRKTMTVDMQYNKFTDNNEISGFGQGKEYEFYSVKDVFTDFKIEDDTHQLVTIILSIDSENVDFVRDTYTFSQMLGDIGGFIDLVKFIFLYFISMFSIKEFMGYIYRCMYFTNLSTNNTSNNTRRVHDISINSKKFKEKNEYENSGNQWNMSGANINIRQASYRTYDV